MCVCEYGEHMLIHKPEEDCSNPARSQLDQLFQLTSCYLRLMLDHWVLHITTSHKVIGTQKQENLKGECPDCWYTKDLFASIDNYSIHCRVCSLPCNRQREAPVILLESPTSEHRFPLHRLRHLPGHQTPHRHLPLGHEPANQIIGSLR